MRELRDGAADRLPTPARVLPVGWVRTVPWRAAVIALVLAVVVGTTVLARARDSAQEGGAVVPPRRVVAGAATGRIPAAREPGGGLGPSPGSSPPGPVDGTARSPNGTAGPASAGGAVVVHVIGRVRRPGLVRLPVGSRVWDAVVAAGGGDPGARLDRLNLARPLGDGEQVTVPGATDPVPIPAPPAAAASGRGSNRGSGGGVPAGSSAAPVDLNTATAADLDGLPGVGPVLADRILAWRTQHSRFSRVEELGEVPGIGDKLLARLTPLVRV